MQVLFGLFGNREIVLSLKGRNAIVTKLWMKLKLDDGVDYLQKT